METQPTLSLYGSPQIQKWLEDNPHMIVEIVRQSYVNHHAGKTTNPDSYFLNFRNEPDNRIIALPSVIDDHSPVAGIKWISSFPANTSRGLDRASALIVVNDRQTGYPLACMEGSLISAARTAASAVIGFDALHNPGKHIRQLGIVGCGPIAFTTVNLLLKTGWTIDALSLSDTRGERAEHFQQKLAEQPLTIYLNDIRDTITHSDAILFTTSSITPYVEDPLLFSHHPTVIHLSLRDLSPDIIRSAQNVADDISHCLKANTSLHLTEQQDGNHLFIELSISDFITGNAQPDKTRTRIYSPFGMGILDLAVARAIMLDGTISPQYISKDFFPTPYLAKN